MAAGALFRAVRMIDDWDSTWISNPRGTYGAGNINRYKTPVIGLRSRQLKPLNVNQLHAPYSHFFSGLWTPVHCWDPPPTPFTPPPPSFVQSSCSDTRDRLEKKQGSRPLCIQLRVMFKSSNPKIRTEESRMVARYPRQIDRHSHTLFGYLSIGVKPSIAVISPFHTSANAVSPAWILASCSGDFKKYMYFLVFKCVFLVFYKRMANQ